MGILEVKNLTKIFGNGKNSFTAVNNISFSLQEGEILGLLGRNGAGKTTTIQMLLGLLSATSGSILYFGKEFAAHREETLQQINYSSTYISMPWFFTVAEILDLYARLYQIADRKKRIAKLLVEFELEHLVKKQFQMLSAGEKTRLLITKSFLNYPKVLLLDEPTASLDPEIAVKIREFLKKERKEYNVSMLLTSHNMSEVEEMCNRIMIIKQGTVIAEDTPRNLVKQITKCTVYLTLSKDQKKAETYFTTKHISYKRNNDIFVLTLEEKNIADFFIRIGKEKIGFDEISINKPNLEDFFLQVIKEDI